MSDKNRDLFKGILMLPCLLPKANKGDFWIFDAPDSGEHRIGGACGVPAKRGYSLTCDKTNEGGHWCKNGEFFTIERSKRGVILSEIELEPVSGSELCEFSVIENKLEILYRNQERILQAIKSLRKQ